MTPELGTAYSAPDIAPLFRRPPYTYRRYEKISVICRGDRDALARVVPSPLSCASDEFEVYFLDAAEVDGLNPYREAGIVLKVNYGDLSGEHVAFEYVSTDDALCSGREIWGYPKKLAQVTMEPAGSVIECTASRQAHDLITMRFESAASDTGTPRGALARLLVRHVLSESGDGGARYVVRNTLRDATVSEFSFGRVRLELGATPEDPLSMLAPYDVVSAHRVTGSFVLGFGERIGNEADTTRS